MPLPEQDRGLWDVAVAEMHGAQSALDLIAELPLDGDYLLHAIRADLLRRLSRHAEAIAACEAAIARTDDAAEVSFLRSRISPRRSG